MSIALENEKMVQLRMWAVDTSLASFSTEVTDSHLVSRADALVKFVLGE